MAEKIVCIVQARRRSTRLPDKILKPLAGQPALAHVLKRCMAIASVNEVICAGIDDPYEDPIFDVALQCGASCFRGSEHDVLSRYYLAAKQAKADWVMRVTSDCPLFDPEVANDLVKKTLNSRAKFGANARWPHGLDCELFTFEMLEAAHFNASSEKEREHVTLWMKWQKNIQKVHLFPPDNKDYGKKHRWVLDYPDDYEFLQNIFTALSPNAPKARWRDIVSLENANPSLPAINAHCAHDWAKENNGIHQQDT